MGSPSVHGLVQQSVGAIRGVLPHDEAAGLGTGMGSPSVHELVQQSAGAIRGVLPHDEAAGWGTGMGSPSVHGLVQQSAGAIRVTSAPGEGSTFELFFPRSGDEVESRPRPVPETIETTTRPGRIFVVKGEGEGEGALRAMARRVLERAGHAVSVAAVGAEALDALKTDALDAVVSDIVMPRMSGIELAQRLEDVDREIPILLMSGHPDEELARHGAGDLDPEILAKPYTGEQLAAAVEQLLEPAPQ